MCCLFRVICGAVDWLVQGAAGRALAGEIKAAGVSHSLTAPAAQCAASQWCQPSRLSLPLSGIIILYGEREREG